MTRPGFIGFQSAIPLIFALALLLTLILASPAHADSLPRTHGDRPFSCTINTYNNFFGGNENPNAEAVAVQYLYHSNCGYYGGNVAVADWITFCGAYDSHYGYLQVQSDPWTTNQPWFGGSRYNDPGRSTMVGIPYDCSNNYWLNQAGGSTPSPKWGCSWYNLGYPIYQTQDDMCYFIQS